MFNDLFLPIIMRNGVNHEGSQENAKELIKLAQEAGTQLINKPSILLCQKSGFVLQNSTFILYKHS